MSRYRERLVQSMPYSGDLHSRNSRGTTTYFKNSGTLAVKESIEDVVTPGYFKMVREGAVLPANPLTIKKESVTFSPPGRIKDYATKMPSSYDEFIGSIAFFSAAGCKARKPSVSDLPGMLDISAGNSVALQAVANARQEAFDILTFAAEFRETAGMVASATRNFFKRVSRLSSMRGAATTIADLWLEYRYGWAPLVSDLESIRSAVNSLNQRVLLLHGHSSTLDLNETSKIIVSAFNPKWYTTSGGQISGPCPHGIERVVTRQRKFRASCLVELSSLGNVSFDPIMTGWEIIPYSFVVDWLVNIQTNLLALSPFQQGVMRQCSLTQITSSTHVYRSFSHIPVGSKLDSILTRGDFVSDFVAVEASVHSRQPYNPSLELSFQNPFKNVKHAFDSLALSRRQLLKTLQRFN